MALLGIGEKDRYGRQKRIAHEGKFLRASRTGGISLRAQTRAAGLNLTANTRHGLRVSHRLGRKTQLAFQNGRLVFRGRYGSGPTRLNVSKTGMTVSTRNPFGTINWIKPNRSSAKLFGVQVRGQKALFIQMVMLAITGVVALASLAINLCILLINVIVWLATHLWNLTAKIPDTLDDIAHIWRKRRLRQTRLELDHTVQQAIDDWSQDDVIHANELMFLSVARGHSALDASRTSDWPLAQHLTGRKHRRTPDQETHQRIGALIEHALTRDRNKPDKADHTDAAEHKQPGTTTAVRILALTALIAKETESKITASQRPELLFALDDLMLEQGSRNVLQDQMLEVFADQCGLRLTNRTH